jgi:protease-4
MKKAGLSRDKRWYIQRALTLVSILFLAGCTCFSIPLMQREGKLEETVVSGKGKDKILLVDISGVISSKEQGRGLFGERASMVSRVREELEKASKDERVRGVILRLNTPGGTITASDIIYQEIKRFKRERNLPVVACMMELATSGGYYVATAADTIVAHPTTVTGSLGAIAIKFNAEGLMEKIGIEDETIMAGDKKDLFSPLRPLTEEERVIIQDMLNEFHQRFISLIAENRKTLSLEQVKPLADGRVYTADQALKNGLVDEVGYLDDVIEMVKGKAGLEKAKVVMYHRPYSYKSNIYSQMRGTEFKNLNLINLDLSWLVDGAGGLRFMYMWLP